MNRIPTLASAVLFAAGLAIFPVNVFAQPNVPSGVDMKTHPTVPAAKTADKANVKPATGATVAGKDATKSSVAKSSTAKATTIPAPTTTGTPAKVGG